MLGAPVFSQPTTISGNKSAAAFVAEVNHSVADVLKAFVSGADVKAVQASGSPDTLFILNEQNGAVSPKISFIVDGEAIAGNVDIAAGKCVKVYVSNGAIVSDDADFPVMSKNSLYDGYADITEGKIANPSFEQDKTYGNANGNVTLGSVVYNPCYTNSIAAANASFPNILPVEGWTAGNALNGGSNYARMYSMPYSTTMYCVSPSNVGNYAAQCARPMADDSCGTRCLTVLNSWTKGNNRISQKVALDKGEYRLLMNMKYECTNQTDNTVTTVTTSKNVNNSLTGIKIGNTTDYRYPAERATWEVMCYDFVLAEPSEVEISLGFSTSQSVGAAENTLLYIDNIRLLAKQDNVSDGIADIEPIVGNADVYSLSGIKLRTNVPVATATKGLRSGIYIVNGKKVVVE